MYLIFATFDASLRSVDIPVPAHWTAEQANAIIDLLDLVRDAIWQRYRKKILAEAMGQQHEPHGRPVNPHRPDFNTDRVPF